MNVEMRRGVSAVAALTVALLLAGCGGVGRREQVRRSRAILAALPVFPGALTMHEFSTPEYGNGEASGPTGYTTTVVYRVPAGTRGTSVRRFYETRLGRRGWQSSPGNGSPASRAIIYLKRGKELAVVNTLTLRRGRTYIVVVDGRH